MHPLGSFPCPPKLPPPADDKTPCSQSVPNLRGISNLLPRSQKRTDLVARQPFSLNVKRLVSKIPDRYSSTGASTLGWGARCGDLRTVGLWSQAERLFHLNCLELIAGGFTLKSFVKHRRHIKVLMQTSASFMNKMGGHPLASSPPPPPASPEISKNGISVSAGK